MRREERWEAVKEQNGEEGGEVGSSEGGRMVRREERGSSEGTEW